MTARELQQVGNDPTSGSDRVCTDDGECVGGPETEIAQKEPAHGYQWSRVGHPDATPQEQVQVKIRGQKSQD